MTIILIVEDEFENQQLYADIISRVEKELGLQFLHRLACDFEEAQKVLEQGLKVAEEAPVLILLDMELPCKGRMDKRGGYRLMQQYRKKFVNTFWIPLTGNIAWHEIEMPSHSALFDDLYRMEPFAVFSKGTPSELREIVRRALKLIQEISESKRHRKRAVDGHMFVMSNYRLYYEIRRAAEDRRSILLFGEPGTGKSLTAHLIHHYSGRKKDAFHSIDGMMDTSSLVKLLFPLEKKDEDKEALLTLLNQVQFGTLYISDFDQLGDSGPGESLSLQRRLLHYLKYRGYDVRIIGGINQNRKGYPLFDRILPELLDTTIALDLPPLYERKEDIPALLTLFLEQYNNKLQKRERPKRFVDFPSIYKLLQSQDWQERNITQLRMVVEETLLKASSTMITAEDFKSILELSIELTSPNSIEVTSAVDEKNRGKFTKRSLIITDEDLRKHGIY